LPVVLVNSNGLIIMLCVSIFLLTFTKIKIKLRDLFLLGGLIVLSFNSGRQVSLLVLLGVFVINKLISEVIEKHDPEGTEKMLKIMLKTSGQVLTIFLVALLCYTYGKDRVRDITRSDNKYIITEGKIAVKEDIFIDERKYPVDAAKYIKENIDISKMRLYNEYNYGSYLLFQDIKVFIDSRADLYTKEFNGSKDIFSDFLGVSSLDNDYEKVFEKYNITHMIFPKGRVINKALVKDENYKEIYSDKYFIVYERENVGDEV